MDIPEKLLKSKKYGDVCPDTVARIWAECQVKYKKPKDADRAAREALHGLTGAFLTPGEALACRTDIRLWAAGDQSDDRLEAILRHHASIRERLPLESMDVLYSRIFEITGTPKAILDLACGINPIYLCARGHAVTGIDISGHAVDLVNAFGESCPVAVKAICADLLCGNAIPAGHFDIALMFKILPLLNRQYPDAVERVFNAIDADFLVISFPTRTLSGKNVGMANHYGEWMSAHLPMSFVVRAQFEIKSEMYYIICRT